MPEFGAILAQGEELLWVCLAKGCYGSGPLFPPVFANSSHPAAAHDSLSSSPVFAISFVKESNYYYC